MTPATLIADLDEEYMFAEIAEAAILSFAAENEARLRSMTSARPHVDERIDRLQAGARDLRQEEITSEIVEPAANAGAVTNDAPWRRQRFVSRQSAVCCPRIN